MGPFDACVPSTDYSQYKTVPIDTFHLSIISAEIQSDCNRLKMSSNDSIYSTRAI